MSQLLVQARSGEPGYAFDNSTDHPLAQYGCLEAAYDPWSTGRLAATGVGPGWHCLEIGAGNGSVAHWLADQVGEGGRVLATDLDTRRIQGRPNLAVEQHDIGHDPLPEGAFDLIHARLVLQHVPRRRAVLDRLLTALKPGGWLQIDEFDVSYGPVLLAPDGRSAELYEAFLTAKSELFRAAGGDPCWGRDCAAQLCEAGFTGLDPQPTVLLWQAGHPGLELLVSHLDGLRERLLAQGLTEGQLDELRLVMRHPDFRAVSPVLYSVHARRPR
ncbi:class I SAM-dependent methyltransferase [Kitasatospora sp. NBC_01287]|uniref:class I SAM-dependent methyltransferase n=1 Tax=Kitasatospora sp. NBC_01287 TaxID=2903573 RepID=UPI00225A134E|nr:class I SAM-dependent methyltransferase [Kitasatospora sp. NBC_01287]MCX4747955.1 class I SAM-dependent methyltransferase [Kitasatospora sp. NBC_01287]